MVAIASQITSFTIVYSTVYSDVDQRKHQSSASLDLARPQVVNKILLTYLLTVGEFTGERLIPRTNGQ